MNDFTSLIEQIVRPLHAFASRKQAMRDELLTHLQAAYEDELRKHRDPIAAFEAARRRFGDINKLGDQLQASIPLLERLLARFSEKEISMSRWLWIVGWMVVLIAMIVIAPDGRLPLSVVAVVGAIGMLRLTQKDNRITRWLGPRWGWRAFGVLVGTGIVLPALAKLKHGLRENALTPDIKTTGAIFLSLGVLIILIGLASTIHSITARFSATA